MSLENFIATLLVLLLSNAGVIGWVVRESFKRADSTTAKLIDHLQAQATLLITNNEAQRREAMGALAALQQSLERQRLEDREIMREHTEASKEIFRGMQEIMAHLQIMSTNGKTP